MAAQTAHPNKSAQILQTHPESKTASNTQLAVALEIDFVYSMRRSTVLESIWWGVRVVEGARLESVYRLTPIEGSNPSLTANSI